MPRSEARKTRVKRAPIARPKRRADSRGDKKPAQVVTRDPERSKQRILRFAAEEFAKRGYDGARVDEIVRRCKVSKNLIYHYFNSKEALFISVLEAAYASLRQRQEEMGLESSEPLEAISKLVVDTFRYWNEARDFIAYLNSENLYNAKHIKKSKFITSTYPGLMDSIRDVLIRGEKQGVFRSGVDPIQLYISISALAYHFFSNQSTFSVIFGKDFSGADVLRLRLEHTIDLVLGYLRFKPDR
jgi:TetR/AcrR family transcriptional regulator